MDDWTGIEAFYLNALIRQITTTNSLLVNSDQLDKLYEVLDRCMLACKEGDAQAILDDCLCAPHTIRPDAKAWHRDVLNQFYMAADEQLPHDPMQVMEVLVNRHYDGDEGSDYTNLYNQISVDGSKIELTEHIQLPPSMHEHLKLLIVTGAKKFPNSIVGHLPSIQYLKSPEVVLTNTNKFLCADV